MSVDIDLNVMILNSLLIYTKWFSWITAMEHKPPGEQK